MIKLYRRLNLGWKRLLWVLGILFSLIGPGILDSTLYTDIFNPNIYLNSWSIEETIIVVYLSLVGWWVVIFIILWIINMIPSQNKFSIRTVKLVNKHRGKPKHKSSTLKIQTRVPAARNNTKEVQVSHTSSGPSSSGIKEDIKSAPQNIHQRKESLIETDKIKKLQEEINQLHKEIRELKQDYNGLKRDDKELKEEVKQIKNKLIKNEIKELEDKTHLDNTSKQLRPTSVEESEIKIKPLSSLSSKEG